MSSSTATLCVAVTVLTKTKLGEFMCGILCVAVTLMTKTKLGEVCV